MGLSVLTTASRGRWGSRVRWGSRGRWDFAPERWSTYDLKCALTDALTYDITYALKYDLKDALKHALTYSLKHAPTDAPTYRGIGIAKHDSFPVSGWQRVWLEGQVLNKFGSGTIGELSSYRAYRNLRFVESANIPSQEF